MSHVEFARPLQRRCTARLSPKDSPVYHGRCDRRRNHEGPHALERGMDIVYWFSVLPARYVITPRYRPGPGVK